MEPSRAVAPQDPAAGNVAGSLWMLLAVAMATGMTVTVREASAALAPAMIAFLRSGLGLLALLPFLLRRDALARLRVRRPKLHLLRAAVIAGALNGGFYAIVHLPLATATILFFLAPIFATALAPLMAGERVGPRRWAAVGVGFLGALIVLRPGWQPLELAMLGAVGSSLCYALSLMLAKVAGGEDGPDAVFVSMTVLVAAFTLPPALLVWRLPPLGSEGLALWSAVAAVALFSAVRGYADIRAYVAGEAAVVAPVSYLRLPAIGFAGWALFDERVDFWTWLGGGVIVASTLYIVLREAALRRRERRAAAEAGDTI